MRCHYNLLHERDCGRDLLDAVETDSWSSALRFVKGRSSGGGGGGCPLDERGEKGRASDDDATGGFSHLLFVTRSYSSSNLVVTRQEVVDEQARTRIGLRAKGGGEGRRE